MCLSGEAPARQWQSVEQSSLDTWFDRYALYARPDLSISYYNKGQLDGFLLDVLIRDATDNHRSLDDVMRAMNEQFAKKHRFYHDTVDIEATAEKIAGVNLTDFFARYVAGTDELPYAEILAKAGLRMTLRDARGEAEYRVSEAPDVSDKQRRIRDGILHGHTD